MGMMLHQCKFIHLSFVFLLILKNASPEANKILIFTPEGEVFNETINGLKNELSRYYKLEIFFISKEMSENFINEKIESISPKVIFLLGNRAIKIFKTYIQKYPAKNGNVPVIALLASQVEGALEGLVNVGGIAYETPMVTALINFRSIFGMQISKVGVIYRSVFEKFINQHTEYCKREKIIVKSIHINDSRGIRSNEIKNAIKQLLQKEKVDVFWVPNDNRLLESKLLSEVWIPIFNKHKIPVVVGVETLAKPDINLGTYAVIPEPISMGEQAAQMVFDLEESGWKFTLPKIYPAISVYSVLNMKKLSGISTAKLNIREVNKIFE